MIRKEKLTAIIPVRKGSKGIHNKNLYQLGKYSLLERTIIQAKSCKYIDNIIVSTDDEAMYAIAKKHNVSMPSLRPRSLAQDDSSTLSVIEHALRISKITSGHVILLQVTTPLRLIDDFLKICEQYENIHKNCTSMISVNQYNGEHPNKIQKINNGYLESYMGVESMVPRQSLPEVYELNGAFYITSYKELKKNNSFYSKNIKPFIMSEERSFNLDTKFDLYLFELLLEKKEIKFEEY